MFYGAAAFATETFSQGPSSFGSIVVVPTGVREPLTWAQLLLQLTVLLMI